MNNRGYTLIEIMVALLVFSIIAMITSAVLIQTLHVQERVDKHSHDMTEIELMVSRLQQDIDYLVPRAVRGNEMHLFPPIIAQTQYIEFTRGGINNPNALEQRSNLIRVAYVCENHQLIRRVWQQLDTADRQAYDDMPLMSHLTECHFSYAGIHNQWVSTWYQAPIQSKKMDSFFLPKLIQFTFSTHRSRKANQLIWMIPEG